MTNPDTLFHLAMVKLSAILTFMCPPGNPAKIYSILADDKTLAAIRIGADP
jgi:hypothetical protein